MARKVYTVELNDEKLIASKGSKAAKVSALESQIEVEAFGIVEINNNSSKKKIKNKKDAGFEKNVLESQKKAVKSNLAQIDDYFDFSFRPTAKVEEKVVEEKVVEKKVAAKKTACKTTKTTDKKEIIDEAKACQTYTMSDEARKVVSVARAGSLFG
jgi:hypothetical protein